LTWNFRDVPHALITGITKGGKTYFLSYMILCFVKAKAILKIIDPKKSDLLYLENYLGKENVVSENWHIARMLREALEEMEKRYKEFKDLSNYGYGKDYADYGYQPYVVLFDEVMAFMGGSAERKLKDEVNERLLEIIAKGRQAGVYIILTTQRADAKYIDASLRDQLGLRVALGKMSESGYRMTFGDEYKSLKLKNNNKGAGYVYIDGLTAEPQEFVSPFMDFDFISMLESMVGKKVVDVDIQKEQEAN
jgi:DNA segregation ATPase FtsK/SpoIIIE-like protein